MKSPELDAVEQGCALLEALASDPEMRVIAEELAEGTELDDESSLVLGDELKRRVKAANRPFVALWVLRVFGRLDDVQTLSIRNVSSLTNLEHLDLSECVSLTNVDGISELTNLQTLNLNHCSSLRCVDVLSELTNLQTLSLGFCRSLMGVDALSGLMHLKTLNLAACSSLRCVDVLSELTNLQTLSLYRCSALSHRISKSYNSRTAVAALQARLSAG